MYVVVVTVFLICSLLIVNVKRGDGRARLRIHALERTGVGDDAASASFGRRSRFAMSAFVAGLGGALYGSRRGERNPRSFKRS